jgi:hypothetical protein
MSFAAGLWRRAQAALQLSLLTVLGAGCGSNFHEVHYFKSVDRDQKPIHYYRVTVEGNTALSSSRYISGYFDERAVDIYFSEFSQPPAGSFTGTVKKDEEGKVAPLAKGMEGRQLVLLLSSNSDDIATSISALAQSEAVTQTLANVIGRDRLDAATDAQINAPIEAASGAYLVASGKTLVQDMKDDAALDVVTANLKSYANELANFLESGKQFDKLSEANTWAERQTEAKP